jgi:hypothetical protein
MRTTNERQVLLPHVMHPCYASQEYWMKIASA